MQKFENNQTKIKGGCQLGRKVVTHDSKSDLPLGGRSANSFLSQKLITFQFLSSNLISKPMISQTKGEDLDNNV